MLYYKFYKINFKHGSNIESPDWIKKKKATINKKKKKVDKCFQYAAAVALNYGEIKWNPERISNIKPFINKYNSDKKNTHQKIDDQKTFEKNNLTIALNVLYTKEMEICLAYISKYNSTCEKQITLLYPPMKKVGIIL